MYLRSSTCWRLRTREDMTRNIAGALCIVALCRRIIDSSNVGWMDLLSRVKMDLTALRVLGLVVIFLFHTIIRVFHVSASVSGAEGNMCAVCLVTKLRMYVRNTSTVLLGMVPE